MVYRPSMSPLFAILLASAAAQAQAAPPPAEANAETTPTPAESAPDAARRPRPADPGSTAILPLDPRMEAYDQFRRLYETERFDEALPLARRVIELSEQGSDHEYELPIAYNNLGATQYQLGEHVAAEASYRHSLELLEASVGISSRRLIVPLAGLGAVHAALDQHALAAAYFSRALAVSRRAEGLFNLAQLPLIEQAADSLYALADYGGVERERIYALKIAEQNYGYGDERTLPAILKLATFYEDLREFNSARMMYLRARDVSMKESGGFNPAAIRSQIGIARTHRLQYTMDPESLADQQPARDAVTGEVFGRNQRGARVSPPSMDRTGLKAARDALDTLRAVQDPPPQLLLETLTELGDWYQATSRPALALPYYQEASALVDRNAEAGLVNGLASPRMVFYRPPLAASRGLSTATSQFRVRRTEFRFRVSEDGEPQNIEVISTDMSEGQLAQSRRALSRAIYCPRFENGRAVASEDVRFTAEWTEQHDAQQDAALSEGQQAG